MQAAPSVIAGIALGVAGLTITVLNYRRDRARIRATSVIEWHKIGTAPDVPHMRIRIQNRGRRPTSVTHLVAKEGKQVWTLPLVPGGIDCRQMSMDELAAAIKRLRLSPTAPVELPESKIHEIVFSPEDGDDFVFTAADAAQFAEALFVEDTGGTRHPVRGSKRDLRVFHEAWWRWRSGFRNVQSESPQA